MLVYTPSFIPQRILVVGCGGTGSRLIPQIAQFIKTVGWVISPEMVIVDNDIVEEKNLRRQNFVSLDINKHKAVVLAQRYSKAYDLNIIPFTEKVTRNNTECPMISAKLQEWANNPGPVMLIMCVDSAEARRDILYKVSSACNADYTLVIDTGNENDFGQVNVSTLMAVDADASYLKALEGFPKNVPGEIKIPLIPLDILYYANMVSSPAPSCADLDQTMAINSLVATTAFGVIQNWYYARPMSFFKINVTLSHGSVPEYITEAYLIRLIKATKSALSGRENVTFLPRGTPAISFNKQINQMKEESKKYKELMEVHERAEKEEVEKAALESKKVEAVNILKTISTSLEAYLGVSLDLGKKAPANITTPRLTEEEKEAVEAIKRSLEKNLVKKIPGVEVFSKAEVPL